MFDKNLTVLLQNWYSNKMKLGHLRSENKVWKFVGWNENGGGAVGGWVVGGKEGGGRGGGGGGESGKNISNRLVGKLAEGCYEEYPFLIW